MALGRTEHHWNRGAVAGSGRCVVDPPLFEFWPFRAAERHRGDGILPVCAGSRGSNRNDAGSQCTFSGSHSDLQQADERSPRRNQPWIGCCPDCPPKTMLVFLIMAKFTLG